jgi:hypothetical protein
MQPIAQKKRKGRQLLVAAVGIASVSYVGTLQGCADVDPSDEGTEGSPSAEVSSSEDVGQSQQALTSSAAAATSVSATLYRPLPPSGNLMPGPVLDPKIVGPIVIKVPIPVGNLMVVPVDQLTAPEAVQAGVLTEQR